MSLNISDKAREAVWTAELELKNAFQFADSVEFITQGRVLEAFQTHEISARHFAPTNGYGYDDIGRDNLDRVFADALQAESAYVRPQFANGTHAIFCALAGLTEPGDEILAITGDPYDTLEEAIGIRGSAPNSLARFGISFRSVPLEQKLGKIQMELVEQAIQQKTKIIYVQRSRGYAWRPSFSPMDLKPIFEQIHAMRPDVWIVVDNCYGEFTQAVEPTSVGADVIVGSLIKNPGGGIAPCGGYVAGRKSAIDRIAERMTVPGMGREVGSYEASYRPFYQGLFLAPHVTAQSIKSAMLFAKIFEALGYDTIPSSGAPRSDIIQSVRFGNSEALVAFCQSIQAASPVDSCAVPEPWDMPGYAHQVIMAAGTFVQGATTELSADAPMKEPYIAYMQGALTYTHGKIAAMLAYDALCKGRIKE